MSWSLAGRLHAETSPPPPMTVQGLPPPGRVFNEPVSGSEGWTDVPHR